MICLLLSVALLSNSAKTDKESELLEFWDGFKVFLKERKINQGQNYIYFPLKGIYCKECISGMPEHKLSEMFDKVFLPRIALAIQSVSVKQLKFERTDRCPWKNVVDGVDEVYIYEYEEEGEGIRVRIRGSNGIGYAYYHMQKNSNLHLNLGDVVQNDDQIGTVGGSGNWSLNEFAPHLHIELWDANNVKIPLYQSLPFLIRAPRRN